MEKHSGCVNSVGRDPGIGPPNIATGIFFFFTQFIISNILKTHPELFVQQYIFSTLPFWPNVWIFFKQEMRISGTDKYIPWH